MFMTYLLHTTYTYTVCISYKYFSTYCLNNNCIPSYARRIIKVCFYYNIAYCLTHTYFAVIFEIGLLSMFIIRWKLFISYPPFIAILQRKILKQTEFLELLYSTYICQYRISAHHSHRWAELSKWYLLIIGIYFC